MYSVRLGRCALRILGLDGHLVLLRSCDMLTLGTVQVLGTIGLSAVWIFWQDTFRCFMDI